MFYIFTIIFLLIAAYCHIENRNAHNAFKVVSIAAAVFCTGLQYFVFNPYLENVQNSEISAYQYNDITKEYAYVKGTEAGTELKKAIDLALKDGMVTNAELDTLIEPKFKSSFDEDLDTETAKKRLIQAGLS